MAPVRWMGIAVAMLGCTQSGDGPEPSCAAAPLATCIADYGAALRACYEDGDAPCAADDAGLTAALDALSDELGDCSIGELDAAATAGRIRSACASEATSLASRSFGGPHGAVWADVGETNRTCLLAAHEAGTTLLADTLQAVEACAGGDCGDLPMERNRLANRARQALTQNCRGFPVPDLIAVDTDEFVQRAAHQADCLLATAYADGTGLELACGPDHAQFRAPRGEWTQIVVDGEILGTQCGDGSPYAFQVRLAPEGQPLDRVVVGMQGGGVCLFEGDCAARLSDSPGLFEAMDDEPPSTGIFSTDPSESAFADWTKVYLPYCTQDVFGGGGVAEELGEVTIERYGSVDVRAAMQMVRDVLWREMDAAGGAGYRADEVVALFGGWSAGGYGTLYNYHWVLDDLQWPHTAAFPDAALGLDNGGSLSVAGIGVTKIPAWNMKSNLPPYCSFGDCALGPVMYEQTSPRLLGEPEQQMLIVSNPFDQVQVDTQFFEGPVPFLNELRETTCATRDLPGIQYYYTSVSEESVHVVSVVPELWTGSVDGVVMQDWFVAAIEQPDTIDDRIEEGDFTEVFEGVEPYPCEVAP